LAAHPQFGCSGGDNPEIIQRRESAGGSLRPRFSSLSRRKRAAWALPGVRFPWGKTRSRPSLSWKSEMSDRTLRVFQHLLLVAGIVLLAASALALVDRSVSSRLALRAFDEAQAAGSAREHSGTRQGVEDVDFSLWSQLRIRAYKESLSIEKRLPWAVLGISKLRIRVPVFDGTDDLTLNRGVGWIDGTARPGESGNIGIAGHRDGFFRGLKDIAAGDAIELTTSEERATYVVDEIQIVSPERVDVLQPRGSPSLTLVTCYPFYFIGDAPQRFIVHATLKRTVLTTLLDAAGDKPE
jgi:sortase A